MFLRNKHNIELVNLSNVTYIHPSVNKNTGKAYIYFIFDAMNKEDMNEIKWEFPDEAALKEVLDILSVVDT